MKASILCLYVARIVALPSGVYILDGTDTDNQYYNPFGEPHSQRGLHIRFRGDNLGAAVSTGCTVPAMGVSEKQES